MGDFFGLNLGPYQVYESAFLACSPGKSLNCYFAMPFKQSARFTVTNEGTQEVGSFYSNIDYMTVPSCRRRAVFPCAVSAERPVHAGAPGPIESQSRRPANYVYMETRGSGHLMGVTLGVLQNAERLVGRGRRNDFRRR